MAVAVVAVAAAAVFLYQNAISNSSDRFSTNNTSAANLGNTSIVDPYAHLGTASFVLVAPYGVYSGNQHFDSLAGKTYNFSYSNSTMFDSVKNSTYIVLVVNSSSTPYYNIALDAVNRSELDYALNSNGMVLNSTNTWHDNQSVYVLAGYRNASSLSSVLLSFFIRQPVYAPRSASGRFISFNGIARGGNYIGSNDPIIDAYLSNTYELGPHDPALYGPYSYYDNFAYIVYYAPILDSMLPGLEGNSSGRSLPMNAFLCVPPPPPPDSSSLCIGDYVAMPMFQVGGAAPQAPQWSFDSGDCSFFGISDCIDAEGWAASGINPQLPYRSIPSVYYGFTRTGSDIPPSLSGTDGPLSSYLPMTWWLYGPGSVGESTGGFQEGYSNQSTTAMLMNDGVEMFAVPTGETPLGNFTVYNSTNASSSYSCSSNLCGMRFNYDIYALMTVSSTIPQNVTVDFPAGYSQAPYANYTAVLEPVTLTTPKIVRTATTTYYFSYWSVEQELGANQYQQVFDTSNATFIAVGPAQVQAVYTHMNSPGTVSIESEYLSPSTFNTCPPPLNCSVGEASAIPYVNVSLLAMNGSRIYSNTTGASGMVTTPVLPGACYRVVAYKRGYSFILASNPTCINGNTRLSAVDTDPFSFNVSWPSYLPYGGAPLGGTIPVNLSLFYVSGGYHAGNTYVHATTDSGTMTGPSLTSPSGNADYIWHAGNVPGLYYINFTASGPFIPTQDYSMPVVAYSGNYSMTLINISVAEPKAVLRPGSQLVDNVTVRACRYSFNLGANATLTCMPVAPGPASMSLSWINDMPAGTNFSFSPNPAHVNANGSYGNTTLSISIGSGARSGNYTAKIKASMIIANALYNSTIPFHVYISQNTSSGGGGCSGLGEITGSVYNNDGNLTAANVTVTDSATGVIAYKNMTTKGTFSTGYTLQPGTYNVTAYAIFSGTYSYGRNRVNVTQCNSTSTSISSSSNSAYGALNVTVFYDGSRAGDAQVAAIPSYSGWYTGPNGEYNSGFTIKPGSYNIVATYANVSNDTGYVNVASGAVTTVDVYIYGNTVTSTSSISTSTSSSTTITSSTTTVPAHGYYSCDTCYEVMIADYSCPSSCPTSSSCGYGGFECT